MEYSHIIESANKLIDELSFCDSQDFIDYIINEVSNNGYCSLVDYENMMRSKYN